MAELLWVSFTVSRLCLFLGRLRPLTSRRLGSNSVSARLLLCDLGRWCHLSAIQFPPLCCPSFMLLLSSWADVRIT